MAARGRVESAGWLSELFGRPVSMLMMDAQGPLLREQDVRTGGLVQAKISSSALEEMDALADMGFRLVESEVDFILERSGVTLGGMGTVVDDGVPVVEHGGVQADPAEGGCPVAAVGIRPATAEDLDRAGDLAAEGLGHSRFRLPWFSVDERRHLYRTWARAAVMGSHDDLCLLAGDGGDRGLVTLRQENGSARIGLLAVAPGHQRRGIGTALLRAAAHWGAQRGLAQLRVATQASNPGAIAFYQAQGARVGALSQWFYR
ncbi:GNAT family N-acetyltransferase [Kineosporia sp. NBRC 101731]|uniref:GNAT family N-acetyltransferase n=1 Tax=Kineosporia sp. NBRC 101731 TaxID=3032199 RepID=UPI00249FA933|nr:GNAT family N-acetyltransferase [Kineosporia sp. NBRC 101731]GLY29211.1 TDP-fucosamine acetyltransferase [Kineosporia sp. NBRC 101731]